MAELEKLGVTPTFEPTEKATNFIRSTWYADAYNASKYGKVILRRAGSRIIGRLLDSESVVALVSKDDPNIVHAWAVGRAPSTLHWAYVPPELRGHGVGAACIALVLGGYPSRIDVSFQFVRKNGDPRDSRFHFSALSLPEALL